MEHEAMATKQASKQAKTKAAAKVDTKIINKPVRDTERKPERRNLRARSRSAAAGGTVICDKSEPTDSRSKLTAGHTNVRAVSMSGADQPPGSTKRAKLIAMLERPEGGSVAEIGQRLGWLPHTVRAAITGLRHAGRAVTRSKDADDRTVYRLAPVHPASQR
jgi:hypothetical protein